MKTATVESDLDVNAAGDAVNFTASDQSKLFGMVISGLYSNKPQSIIRELWSNALDSHVDAGTSDRPFDVTLPTPFNTTLRVRDYGVSLSDDDVKHLYTDLGRSTKEDSNDVVGKWGIGSKSPFAYGDTFTVTTFIDGTKRVYSAIKHGKKGVPAIYPMGVTNTDEDNGLEVSFAVESGDVGAFRTAAQRVGFGFDIKPNIIGDDNWEWILDEPVFSGNNWKAYNDSPISARNESFVRMGPVLYPISIEAMENVLSSAERDLLRFSMIFEVSMGDVDMIPSREALDYGRDKPTVKNLATIIQSVINEMSAEIIADIESSVTYWEACVKYANTKSMKLPDVIKSKIRKDSCWRGLELDDGIYIRDDSGLLLCSLGNRINNKGYSFRHDEGGARFTYNDTTVFVIEDQTEYPRMKNVAQRIKKMYENSKNEENCGRISNIVWVRFTGGRRGANAMVKLLEKIDGARIYMGNELPEAEKRPRGDRRPVSVKYLVGQSQRPITLTENEFDIGGVYTRTERNYYESSMNVTSVVSGLISMECITRCFVVPKTHWKRFDRADQWVLLDVVADKAVNKINTKKLEKKLSRRSAIREQTTNTLFQFVSNILFPNVPSGTVSVFNDFRAWYEGMEKNELTLSKEDITNADLLRAMHREITVTNFDAEVVKEGAFWEEFLIETYPLMPLLQGDLEYSWRRESKENLDRAAAYVKMCDDIQTNHKSVAKRAA